MAETVLAKMAVEISANAANFTKQLQSTQSKLNSFSTGLKDIGQTVGIAFGVGAVASFAFEVAKLAGEAEGVRAAFDRFPESEALMSRLKDATAGTVSELELMKRTVQATNFGISLESLPKLLEFAAVRAQQTGQSVDYLVDSIVTGIGRKSPLILDNLGISSVALKEQMGGVALATAEIGDVSAAVGRIAEEELKKMGGFSENTATKVARLTASWDNFKVTLGNVVTAGGVLAGVLDDLTGILASLSDGRNASFIQYQKNLAESIKQDSEPAIKNMLRELVFLRSELKTPISESFAKSLITEFKLSEEQGARFLKLIREINGETKKATPVKVADPIQIVTLESLQEKVKQLNSTFAETDVTDKKRLTNIGQEIIGVNAQIKVLEDLRKARENANKVEFAPNTVDAYQDAISQLNKELENTNVTDTSRIRILSAQIAGYQEAIKNVEALKRSFQDLSEVTFKVPDTSQLLNPVKVIQESFGSLTFDTTITALDDVMKRFDETMARMANTAKSKGSEIKGAFIDMTGLITSAAVGIGEALGSAISGSEDFGKGILKVVVGFAKQFGEILIATGAAMIAAKLLIKNPYTAIAAGVALVAIASAAGAAISKSHESSFGGGGGSSGGIATAGSSSVQSVRSASEAQDVNITGTIVARGQDLFVVLKNYESANKFLKAGG